MKKILILLLLITSIQQNINAQLIPLPGTQPIEISEINLKNPANSKKIFIGEPAEKLIQAFGSPTTSEPYLFEMKERIGTLYKYNHNEFYFVENNLDSFIIKSNSIHVGKGTNYIKTGDPISVLNTFYPNYVIQDGRIRARIKTGTNEIDGSLIIFTNGSTITEFLLHFD